MVDNVGGTELENVFVLFVHGLGSLSVNLAVFDDVGLAVLQQDETDGLGGIALADDLGGEVDVLGGGEADEEGIADFDERVVDAVGVDVLDTALADIRQDFGEKSAVDTAVSVGSYSNLYRKHD